ncbi:phage holin family protein [Carnimonas bestiolae]|uniref:phage holin family protein n=1 Tax=Carnimonas bestiolae TaxID=3402172 RepID=UPI003EDBBE68
MIDPQDKSKIWEYVLCVVFATFAGGLGYITRTAESGERISIKALIIQTLGAAFTGCIVLLICMHYGVDMIMTGIFTGLSGWMGASATLGMITRKARSKLGLDEEGNDNGK